MKWLEQIIVILLMHNMDYEIRYSSRRRTLDIVVERDGKVIVTAPEGTPSSKITTIIAQQQKWIENKKLMLESTHLSKLTKSSLQARQSYILVIHAY